MIDLPPLIYDHEFDGVMIEHRMSMAELTQLCGFVWACSKAGAKVCNIFLGNDVSADRRIVDAYERCARRHEIGHCNGWGAGHAGARKCR